MECHFALWFLFVHFDATFVKVGNLQTLQCFYEFKNFDSKGAHIMPSKQRFHYYELCEFE